LTVCVKREELLKELGYRQAPDPRLLQLIDDVLIMMGDLAEYKSVYKEICDSEGLPPFLIGAPLKYAGAATLGEKLENRVKELFDKGKPAEAFILDTAGSVAVTKAGDMLWTRIKEDALARGFGKGLRRTPGCIGIELETQRWIFEQLADPGLGITLTESWMMVPRKSLSFLARFGGKLIKSFSCRACPRYSGCTLRV